MNNEEFDINQELEQMRQDYAALKERFDKQQILNDRLMEKAFKADLGWFSFDRISTILAVVLAPPAFIVICIVKHIDWWWAAAMLIPLLVYVWVWLRMHAKLSQGSLYTEDILSATTKIRQFKRQYRRLCLVGIAISVLIIAVGFLMIYHYGATPEHLKKSALILGLLFAVLTTLGVFWYRRMMRACNDILERLKMKDDANA